MKSLIRLKHVIEYIFLVSLILSARALPFYSVIWCVRKFSDIIFYVFRIRVKLTLKNLRIAFGKTKPDKEIFEIARKTYQNSFCTAIEMMVQPEYSHAYIKKLVHIEGKKYMDEALKKGNGAVLVAGHLGNSELMGFALKAYGYPINIVLGEFRNRYSDKILNYNRAKFGINLISRKYALRHVLKFLKNNEIIALMSDQNAGPTGAFVDFFGRPTSTPQGAALFALKTGSAMVYGCMLPDTNRTGYTFYLEPIDTKPSGDKDRDMFRITQEFSKKLEKYVTRFPEHYLWLHNRWKAKPPAENQKHKIEK